MIAIVIFLAGLCWGSFCNVLAYRMLHGYEWVYTRSFCPSCKKTIAAYDLIPIISWLILKGRCRMCGQSISWLYPFIEIAAGLLAVLLWLFVSHQYGIAYVLFFTGLLVTIRTDLEAMLIFRAVTVGLIPIAYGASYLGYLPISLAESVVASAGALGFLWLIRYLFWRTRAVEGLGRGDLDLIACIGAFTGILGAWSTLIVGSIIGFVASMVYVLIKRNTDWGRLPSRIRDIKVPFAPFLALGAITYVFLPHLFRSLLLLGPY